VPGGHRDILSYRAAHEDGRSLIRPKYSRDQQAAAIVKLT
jgi:hypothetical protein